MIKLMELYGLSVAAGVVTSMTLAVLGAHLATRDKSLQTLCTSQGAMVGVLIGLGFFDETEIHSILHLGPYTVALIVATVVFLLGEKITNRKPASQSTIFLALFGVLMACSYLITALVPTLENHLAQAYFGDLATLCAFDAVATLIASSTALLTLFILRRAFSRQSFLLSAFGHEYATLGGTRTVLGFNLLVILLLSLCIQFLGFLFSLGMLFLPTVILTHTSQRRLRSHFIGCAVLAGVSTIVGFLVSLQQTRLPTVPTIVLTLALMGVLVIAIDRALVVFGVRKAERRNA